MAMTLEILIVRVEVLEKQLDQLKISKSDSKTKRTSGYLQYNSAHRAEVKARLEAESDDKIKTTDITKELAVMWRALTETERAEWNTKAKAMKESPKLVNQTPVNLKVDFAPEFEAELEAEEIHPEVKKQEKEKKNDNSNKKRVSGYIFFQKAMRADVVATLKEALEEEGAKIKQSDVMSELGKMWKALDDDEREEWNEKAVKYKSSRDEE